MRNLLSRRPDTERVATETPDGEVVDRRVAPDQSITQRIASRTRRTERRPTVDDRATPAGTATGTLPGTARADTTTRTDTTPGTITRDETATRDGTVTPDAPEQTVETRRSPWAHVSALATLSLVVGVVAVAAALTGLMAAEGIVLGVIGGAIAAGGLVSAGRRGVTGHSVALLGLIASVGAILLGVLAIGGELSWLDSNTDEVTRLHSWLLTQLPWLKHF